MSGCSRAKTGTSSIRAVSSQRRFMLTTINESSLDTGAVLGQYVRAQAIWTIRQATVSTANSFIRRLAASAKNSVAAAHAGIP